MKDFAKIAKPLHEMMRKEMKWSWGERQQRAFEELKERFTMEPVLVTLLWQPLDQCPIAVQAINLLGQISSREHELCNSQENLTGNYNSILPTIYIIYPWSML